MWKYPGSTENVGFWTQERALSLQCWLWGYREIRPTHQPAQVQLWCGYDHQPRASNDRTPAWFQAVQGQGLALLMMPSSAPDLGPDIDSQKSIFLLSERVFRRRRPPVNQSETQPEWEGELSVVGASGGVGWILKTRCIWQQNRIQILQILWNLLQRFIVKNEVVSFPMNHDRVMSSSGFPLSKKVYDTASLRNLYSSSQMVLVMFC